MLAGIKVQLYCIASEATEMPTEMPEVSQAPTQAPDPEASPLLDASETINPMAAPESGDSTATPEPEGTEMFTPEPEGTAMPTQGPEGTAMPTSEPAATANPTPKATAAPTPEPEVTAKPTPAPTETAVSSAEIKAEPKKEPPKEESAATKEPEAQEAKQEIPEPEVVVIEEPDIPLSFGKEGYWAGSVLTDQEGRYIFESLTPGQYMVMAVLDKGQKLTTIPLFNAQTAMTGELQLGEGQRINDLNVGVFENKKTAAQDKSVQVSSSIGVIIGEGDEFTLTATLVGFENESVHVQWCYDDGTGWKDVEGANALTLVQSANAENVNYRWRVNVSTNSQE